MNGLSAWYGLTVGYLGMLPFLAPLLEQRGFEPSEIALILIALPIGTTFAGTGAGALADLVGEHRGLLRVATWGSALCIAAMLGADGAWLIATVVVFSLLRAPIFPLSDAASVHALGSRYGTVRAFGSLCYAVIVLGLGAVRTSLPLAPFALGAVLLLIAGSAVHRVPTLPPSPERPSAAALWAFVSTPAVALVLFVAWLNGLSINLYDQLFTLAMDRRSIPAWVTGAGIAWGVTVEVALLRAGPWLLARFSPRVLFVISAGAGVPRFLGTAWLDAPWAVALLQGLHGLQFGMFWVVGLDWVGRAAPPNLRRSSQAMFNAAAFGLAPITALLVASVWLRYSDLRSLFLALSLPALIASVCAAWIPTRTLR